MERKSPLTQMRVPSGVLLAGVCAVLVACAFPETPSSRSARATLKDKIAFERDAEIRTMDRTVITRMNPNAYAVAPDGRAFLELSERPDHSLVVKLGETSGKSDAAVLDLPPPPSDASAEVSSTATRLAIDWTSPSGSRFLILDRALKNLYYVTECNGGYESQQIAENVDVAAANGQHIYVLRGNSVLRIAFKDLTYEESLVRLSRPSEETLLAARETDLVICQQTGSYPPEVKPWCSRVDPDKRTVTPLTAPTKFYISTITPVKNSDEVIVVVWDGAESIEGKPAYKWYAWGTTTNDTTLLFRDNNEGFEVHSLAGNIFESPSGVCGAIAEHATAAERNYVQAADADASSDR